MFKCFVDSLTRPRNIANHVDMKPIKFIGYLLFLFVVATIPGLMTYAFNNGFGEQISTSLVEELKSVETTYHYVIVDNKLKDTSGKDTTKIIEIKELLNFDDLGISLTGFKTYLAFNPKDEKIIVPGEKENYFLINFGSEKVELSIVDPLAEIKENGKSEMAGKAEPLSHTYEEMGVNGLDFTEIHSYSTYGISLKLEKIVNSFLKPFNFIIYLVGIPSMFLTTASSIAMEILLLSVIVFFFTRTGNLKFIELVKLITLCMTPSVVSSIFLMLPVGALGYSMIYLLGQMLTIVYFYRALRQLYLKKMMK